jgi:phage/plasmid-associated DNA primase
LPKEFFDFLNKITKNNFYYALILRTAIARIIFAETIGQKLQTGFWLFGVPGSGKKLFSQIISKFGHVVNLPSSLTEFIWSH